MKSISLKSILAISLLMLCPSILRAEIVIRDSEVEAVLKEVAGPIIKAANIGQVNIVLLQNNEVNAFTMGGSEIFVNSGLITQFPDADAFKAVIAHELGHVIGQHVSRQGANIAAQNKVALASVALGIVGAIASKNPDVMLAGILGGSDMAEKSILKYSRGFESAADQSAFKLLEQSGNSVIGMQKLHRYFEIEQRASIVDKYSMTHPMSRERLDTANMFLARSAHKASTTSAATQRRFLIAAYKLLAFTTPNPKEFIAKISAIKDRELLLYARAICYMRISEFAKAIEAVDQLMIEYPGNPYYLELKGQILFEFGKKDSLVYYEKALALVKDDALMKMNLAIVALNVYQGTSPEKLGAFIPYIKAMQRQEPESVTPYYYLSLYYGAMSNAPLSSLYLAIYYNKLNDMRRAKPLAKTAIKGLASGSPEWQWAQDIIDRENEE